MAELAEIRDRPDTVLVTIGGQSSRRVVLALDDPEEPDLYFVLTTALWDWAGGLCHRVQDASEDPSRVDFLWWAETAERLHDRIGKTLYELRCWPDAVRGRWQGTTPHWGR